jgi:hypothetical protein
MNNLSMIIDGVKYKTGDKVQCSIHECNIEDAKIYINYIAVSADVTTGEAFICQNVMNGATSPDCLGYERSWVFRIINGKNISMTMINLHKLDRYNCFENILTKAFPGS